MMHESRLLMAQGEPLRVARQMQQSILPMTWPDDERHALYEYATHLGDVIGDFYDHITVPGQPLNLLIGCVNDTGTTATLLSMMAKTQYREQVALMDQLNRPDLLLSGMIQAFSSPHASPWTIKGVCASYDSHTGILRWSGTGDLLGLRIDAQGKITPLQDTQGHALGLQFQDHYPMHTVQIPAGEQVLWLTSAWGHVSVARNIDNASKSLQSLIQAPPLVQGPALIERIARACDESMRSALPRGGLSCLLLHRKA
jgi:serine phosphatase RsbU (regulator of sigma subunit)